MRFNSSIPYQSSHRLAVRTLAFQAGNESSILSGSTKGEKMYRIRDFKVGDKMYRHTNSNWELCGKIVRVTDECYGMRIKSIAGIIMTNKDLFETLGYIGEENVSL